MHLRHQGNQRLQRRSDRRRDLQQHRGRSRRDARQHVYARSARGRGHPVAGCAAQRDSGPRVADQDRRAPGAGGRGERARRIQGRKRRQRGDGRGSPRLRERRTGDQRQRIRLGRHPRGRRADGPRRPEEQGAIRAVGRRGSRTSWARRSTSAAFPRKSTPRSPSISTSTWSAARTMASSSTTATIRTLSAPGRVRQVRRKSRRHSNDSSHREASLQGHGLHRTLRLRAIHRNRIPLGGLFTGAEGIKTAEEAALWGGQAGVAYDPCYHQACDTFANNNDDALDDERRRDGVRDAAVRDEHVRRQRREGQGQLQAADHEDITGSRPSNSEAPTRSTSNEAGRGNSPGFTFAGGSSWPPSTQHRAGSSFSGVWRGQPGADATERRKRRWHSHWDSGCSRALRSS